MFVFDAERIGKWVVEKAGGSFSEKCRAIGYERDGELIGGVTYEGYTQATIFMHSRIDSARKLPREFYWMIFDYPFNQLKVKSVRGIVDVNNQSAQRLNEHIGFQREALLRDYFLDGDAIVYVMTRDNCRFLGGRYVRFSKTA